MVASGHPPVLRFARRLAFGLALAVALVSGLVGGVLAALQADTVQEGARRIALSHANALLAGRLGVERLSGTLPFDVTLEGVTVASPEGDEVLSVERVSAALDPFALLSRRVEVSEVRVDRPRGVILRRGEGPRAGVDVPLARAFALRHPTPEDPTPSAWEVHVARVSLEDGALDGLIPDGGLSASGLGVSFVFALEPGRVRWRDLSIDASRLEARALGWLLDGHGLALRTEGRIEGGQLHVDHLSTQVGPHGLEARGTLTLSGGLDAELEVTGLSLAAAPAGALSRLLPGGVSGTARLSHREGALVASAELHGRHGELGLQAHADLLPEGGLGAWFVSLDGAGRVAPVRVQATGSEEVRGALQFVARGVGLPGAPGHSLQADLDAVAVTPDGTVGHATVEARFLPQRRPLQDGWGLRVWVDDMGLQPWLGLLGEPDLEGRLDQASLRGLILQSGRGGFELTVGSGVKGRASGHVHAGGLGPVSLERLDMRLEGRWDGTDLPELAFRLKTGAVAVAGAKAEESAAVLYRGYAGDDGLRFAGEVSAREVSAPGVRVHEARLPLELALTRAWGLTEAVARPSLKRLVADGAGASERVGGVFTLRPSDGGHALSAEVSASGVSAPAGVASRLDLEAAARWPGELPSVTSPLEGDVRLRLEGLVPSGLAPGVRAQTMGLASTYSAAAGLKGPLRVDGRLELGDLEAPEGHASVASTTFSGILRPGEGALPSLAGQALVAGLSPRTPTLLEGRRFERVEADWRLGGAGRLEARIAAALDERFSLEAAGEAELRRGTAGFASVSLVDRETGRALLEATRVSLTDEAIAAESFALRPRGADAGEVNGKLTLGLAREAPEGPWAKAQVTLKGLDLAALATTVDALVGKPLLARVGLRGVVTGGASLDGPLSAPSATATLSLAAGRGEGGPSGSLDLEAASGRLVVLLEGQRGSAGRLILHASLPAALSLLPPGLTWRPADPVRVSARLVDPDLQALLGVLAPLGLSPPDGLGGAVELEALVEGEARGPVVSLDVSLPRLMVAGHQGGDATLRLRPVGGGYALSGGWERRLPPDAPPNPRPAPLVTLDGRLGPAFVHALASVAGTSDVAGGEPLWSALRRSVEALSLKVPATRLGDTPLAGLVSRPFGQAVTHLSLSFDSARAPAFSLTAGLGDIPGLRPDAHVQLALQTAGDALHGVAQCYDEAFGTQWLGADLFVPGLEHLLENPQHAIEFALADTRAAIRLETDAIRTSELWRLSPSLRDALADLFPDGRASAMVNARGGPDGPTLSALMRVNTLAEDHVAYAAELPPEERAGVLGARARSRNLGNELHASLSVAPQHAIARVLVSQSEVPRGEGDPLPPGLASVSLSLPVGTSALLSGAIGDPSDLPLEGAVELSHFDLEGLVSQLRGTLGSTRGVVGGRVELSGTAREPRFDGALSVELADLTVAPIGFHREDVSLGVLFTGGDQVHVTGLSFPEPLEARDAGGPARGLEAKLGATIAGLRPEAIALRGQLALNHARLVDRRDADLEVSGLLTLSGTAAAPGFRGNLTVNHATLTPRMSSRAVRPIGLPAGVTLVRGAPVAPPEAATRPTFTTGATVDVSLEIPERAVTLEPTLFLAVGEVRALIRPHTAPGGLRVVTRNGRLGVTGGILLPSESVEVYGKRFLIDPTSRIDFTGDLDRDPQLRIAATYDIAHVDLSAVGHKATQESKITVKIDGSALEPQLSFSSDPAMDESNILSIIALGTPAGAAGGVASQARGQVLSAFLSMATLELGRGLVKALPIEVLKIDTLTGDLADMRLTVGKRITDDLYIYYRSDWSSDRCGDMVWAEYRLGALLYVTAEYCRPPGTQVRSDTSVRATVRLGPRR